MRKWLPLALTAVAALGITTPPAHADGLFVVGPSGTSEVATAVTSCPFADNVRQAYLTQGGPIVAAPSPVTGQVYDMACQGGFISHLANGQVVTSVRCVGGDNAVVVLW
jgi:hypothetical protein